MKIGIMQPYLFPYIGYFQLINAVDRFVIYDDVQFMKNGWINRNNILVKNNKYLFTLSVKKDSYKLNVNRRFFSNRINVEKINLIKTIDFSYNKAPYFAKVFPFIKKLLLQINDSTDIATLIGRNVSEISQFLDIRTQFIFSSKIKELNSSKLKGQDRVIKIVKILEGDFYINAIGGLSLYSKEEFKKNTLKLEFIKSRIIKYPQFNNNFIPNLSIIDVIMFNSLEQINKMFDDYELL